MKKINVTFSIPSETHEQLQSLIGKSHMSAFVAKLLDKALKEKMLKLKKAYEEAEEDPDRKKVIDDWAALEGEDWE